MRTSDASDRLRVNRTHTGRFGAVHWLSFGGALPVRCGVTIATLLALGLVVSVFVWREVDRQLREQFMSVAAEQVELLTAQDFEHLSFSSGDVFHPQFRETRDKLWAIEERVCQRFAAAHNGLFVYTVLVDPDRPRFGPEAALEGDPVASPPGTEYPHMPPILRHAGTVGGVHVGGPVREEHGSFVIAAVRIDGASFDGAPVVVGLKVPEEDWRAAVATRVVPVGAVSVLFASILFVVGVARCRRRIEPKPLLRRLLPILTVFSTALISGALITYQSLERGRLMAEESERHVRLVSKVHLQIQSDAERLHTLLGEIVQVPCVADGIRLSDRKLLADSFSEQFTKWQRSEGVSQLTFVDVNLRSVARVHLPDHYGELIRQTGLKTASTTREVSAGLDIGYQGTLALRVAQPVFKDGKIVGYVILGKEIGTILEEVRRTSDGELTVVAPKSALERKQWEQAMTRRKVPAEWDLLPDSVVVYSTFGRLPKEFAEVVNHRPNQGHRHATLNDLIASGDRKWRWRATPLQGTNGADVACLLTFTDSTVLEASLSKRLGAAHSVGAILLSVIFAFTFFVLKRTDLGIEFQRRDLENSREAYRRLFTESASIKLLIDPGTGRIIDANGSAGQFFGRDPSELVGRNIADLTEGGNEAVQALLRHALSRSKSPFECRQIGNVCGPRDVEMYLSTIDQGERQVIHAIVHDVTRRKEAERQVREEKSRLANVLEGTNAGTWEWDIVTDDLYLNERWAEMLGLTLADLGPMTGSRWEEMVHPDDLVVAKQAIERHIADPEARYVVELRMRHADGHWVWIEANGRITERADDGRPLRMFGIHRDISFRKDAEETLRLANEELENAIVEANEMAVAAADANENLERERASLEAIFNSSNVILAIVDEDLKITRANHQAGLLARMHPDLMVGQHLGDTVSCHNRARDGRCGQGPACQTCPIRLAVRRTVASGATISNIEQELVMTRGGSESRTWVSITSSPVSLGDKRLAVLALHDITETHAALQAVREREEAFRALFERSKDPILIIRDGRFVNCNEAAVQALGLASKNEVFHLRPEHISPTFQPDGRPSAELIVEYTELAKRLGHHRFEWVHARPDGGELQVEVVLTPMRIGGEDQLHVAWRDISERKRFEAALVAAHQELDDYFNSSLDLLCIADFEGRFLRLNPQWERTLGYPLADLEGRYFLDFVHPDDVESTLAALADLADGSRVDGFENRYRCRDGSYRWIEWRSRSTDGRIYANARDVTERRTMAQAVEEAERRYRTLIQNSQSIIYTIDPTGVLTFVSPSWETLLGHTPEEVIGQDFRKFVHPEDFAVCEDALRQIVADADSQASAEYRVRHKDGHWCWHRSVGAKVVTDRGVEVVGNSIDITERKNAESALIQRAAELQQVNAALEIMANRDPLTGLVNRRRFLEVVSQQVELSSQTGEPFALLFIDLDNFKYVNDSLGHDAGDRLLREVAEILKSCVGPNSTVSRLGGDEFAILLEAPHTTAAAESVAARIVRNLESPIDLGENTISATCSVGVVGSDSGSTTEELIQNADTAMYYAKHAGKSRWRTFQPFMTEEVQARLDLEADLRQAWEAREFTLHFQPLIDLDTGKVEEVEALLRWDSERRGPVSPAKFVPLAEEINLIENLGAWVLEEACTKAVRWRSQIPGAEGLRVAVNVSGKQIRQPGFSVDVRRILERTGLPPSCLTIEVTETMIVTDLTSNLAQLQALRDMGVRIAIDDFGTGYSSMASLATLPADAVKIDRSFVNLLGGNIEATAIMRALVTLCQVLNLEVVAEGVETPDQRIQAQALGCRLAQGYLFARPMRETDLFDWLSADGGLSCETERVA